MAWLACAGSPQDTGTGPVDLGITLAEPGPWGAGYHASSVTYDDTVAGGTRTLRLALWYPTDDTTGFEPRYNGLLPGEGVFEDASPAPGSFPLLVFSHGHQGFAEASAAILEHLATHGWVVASPDHTGNTTFDGSDRTTEIYAQRPLDLSAVLDHVLGGAEAGLPVLEGPVVASGYSFGGYTVYAVAGATYSEQALAECAAGPSSSFCSTWSPALEAMFRAGFRDERIDAFQLLAAGDFDKFGEAGMATISSPVQTQTGTLDPTHADGQALLDAATGAADRMWVDIEGGGHMTFSDFAGTSLEEAEGVIGAELGWDIVQAYTLAWCRRAAGDVTVDPLLDGSLAPWAEARVVLP